MKIIKDRTFDSFSSDDRSFVFEFIPNVFEDGRGSFSEVLKDIDCKDRDDIPSWFLNTKWIKQINRSKSSESVVRGCHAQRGPFCQGKLVESINNVIYDIITDARPDSKTFGISKVFRLDHKIQNKVWVPRGFLHSFVTTDILRDKEAIFMYYVDNAYDKKSEITVNPLTVLPDVVDGLKDIISKHKELKKDFGDLIKVFAVKETINFSKKDKGGIDYVEFCANVMSEYTSTGKVWYR